MSGKRVEVTYTRMHVETITLLIDETSERNVRVNTSQIVNAVQAGKKVPGVHKLVHRSIVPEGKWIEQ